MRITTRSPITTPPDHHPRGPWLRIVRITTPGSLIEDSAGIDFLVAQIRDGLKAAERNVGHLKWFAKGDEGDFNKGSMVGIDHELSYDRKLAKNYDKLVFILNSRNACEADTMLSIVDDAYEAAYQKFNLNGRVIFAE